MDAPEGGDNGQISPPAGVLEARCVRGTRDRRCRPTRSGINFAPAYPVHCPASPWRPPPAAHRMSWLSRLLGGKSDGRMKPQRLDYLNEALALERQGDFDAALTSYRLALRDHPNDARILQNMAIAFTKTRRFDEAIRHYRRALELDSSLAGAHYGLAFLLLQRADPDGATQHLKTFLAHPPRGPDAQKWIEHATQALLDLGTASSRAPEERTGSR